MPDIWIDRVNADYLAVELCDPGRGLGRRAPMYFTKSIAFPKQLEDFPTIQTSARSPRNVANDMFDAIRQVEVNPFYFIAIDHLAAQI